MRNKEVIRQWNVLRTLDANRHGATVDELAAANRVSKRTIWRDMEALQEVGFPLTSQVDGRRTRWVLMNAPFKGLVDLGISTLELCSLYISREMVEGMAGAPFGAALAALTRKIEKTLPPKMRAFLDQLPSLVETKPGAVKKPSAKQYEQYVQQLLDATADRRVCTMRYFSLSSNATRDYIVHPYRLVHAGGGMYVIAWVPAYDELRTFAVERIEKLSVQDAHFDIRVELPPDAFRHSLGVNRGKPEKIVVAFAPQIRAYVRERVWHRSQKLQDLPDGRVRMTLQVCADAALRTWILGFGAMAKVESPSWLAQEILEQLDEARQAYVPRLDFALPSQVFEIDHPILPGLRSRPS